MATAKKVGARLPRHVALLRGINVAGKNCVAMGDLVAAFEAAGCADVSTYIQSGNVIFSADPTVATRAAAKVTARLQTELGLRVPVLVRTAPELAHVASTNPFVARGAKPEELHVVFLAQLPRPVATRALDPNRSPPDAFVLSGREIFLRCPNGFGKTKLTNDWFERTLATTSTVRNWKTVTKLVELVSA